MTEKCHNMLTVHYTYSKILSAAWYILVPSPTDSTPTLISVLFFQQSLLLIDQL